MRGGIEVTRIGALSAGERIALAVLWVAGLALLVVLTTTPVWPLWLSVAVYVLVTPLLLRAGVPAVEHAAPHDRLVARRVRRAIRRDELFLEYQPKVEVQTGRIKCAEALVRWNHPRRGVVAPAGFIDAVARTGAIHALTRRVVDLALEQAARWRAEGMALSVSINVPPQCLRRAEFATHLRGALDRNALGAGAVRIEVTERADGHDSGKLAEPMDELGRAGVSFDLDDFGVGESSMARLVDLPFSALKIDRSFVSGMARDGRKAVIVHSAILLCRGFDLRCVAEGVERDEEWALLSEWGCDEAQGFLLGRPEDPGSLARRLRDEPPPQAPVAASSPRVKAQPEK